MTTSRANRIAELTQRLSSKLGSRTAAANEVRWLREHIHARSAASAHRGMMDTRLNLQDREMQDRDTQDRDNMRLVSMLRQRVDEHRPLQYLLQSQPFCGLDIRVRRPVLIPRPETEQWLMHVLERATQTTTSTTSTAKHVNILDLCCGSGAIGIAAVHHLLQHSETAHYGARSISLLGLDVVASAVKLTQLNARRLLNADGVCGRHGTAFEQADLFDHGQMARAIGRWRGMEPVAICSTSNGESPWDHVPESSYESPHILDLVLANPPYISDEEYDTLMPDVRIWEDRKALVGTSTSTADDLTTHGRQGTAGALTTVTRMTTANADGLRYYRHFINHLLPRILNSANYHRPTVPSSECKFTRIDLRQNTSSDTTVTDVLHGVGIDHRHHNSQTRRRRRRLMVALEYGGNHQTATLIALCRPYFSRMQVVVDYGGEERALVCEL